MTPVSLAREVVSGVDIVRGSRVLEPSCGDGAFLDAIMTGCRHSAETKPSTELVAIEVDTALADRSRALVSRLAREGSAARAQVYEGDFFRCYLSGVLPGRKGSVSTGLRHTLLPGTFDLIVGNPPFGGTFEPHIEDTLDARLGRRLGMKVKKETYAFFLVACIDLLRPGGRLLFICSDSLLTIPTMRGLRHFLMHSGAVAITSLKAWGDGPVRRLGPLFEFPPEGALAGATAGVRRESGPRVEDLFRQEADTAAPPTASPGPAPASTWH